MEGEDYKEQIKMEVTDAVEGRDDEEDQEQATSSIYLPGMPIDENEELECDLSAYRMLHTLNVDMPCLSFDTIQDKLGDAREEDDESDDDEDDNNLDAKPDHIHVSIPQKGCCNRVRCSSRIDGQVFAASFTEFGKVHIFDITQPLCALDDMNLLREYTNAPAQNPVTTFGHVVEGYAVDWSPCVDGRLATGDCQKNIHVWEPREDGWFVDQRPYVSHHDSVEDIQWSPSEASVFCSCSVDRSLKIWDIREPRDKACKMTNPKAHKSDVNVISWNRLDPFIVSGGDDGFLKVWDLRQFKHNQPVAFFDHHKKPITSVEWNPNESSILAASGEDEQLTLWDLAVEKMDPSATEEVTVPAQLLFIHQGQKELKELHWHKQLPGILLSTGLDGIAVFRTISV